MASAPLHDDNIDEPGSFDHLTEHDEAELEGDGDGVHPMHELEEEDRARDAGDDLGPLADRYGEDGEG